MQLYGRTTMAMPNSEYTPPRLPRAAGEKRLCVALERKTQQVFVQKGQQKYPFQNFVGLTTSLSALLRCHHFRVRPLCTAGTSSKL